MSKSVLIVGGSGGIGQEIINLLLSNNHTIINVDAVYPPIKNQNLKTITCNLENTTITKITDMLKDTHIDIFISCIGFYAIERLENFTMDTFRKSVRLDVEVPTEFSVELLNRNMISANGKMIFISSAAAYIGSRDLSYSITKSGLIGLVRSLTKNLESRNIYVYGVAPGIVETSMSDQMDTKRQNDTINRTLNKRKCLPIEVANIIDYIIEKEIGYMNGNIFHINNGLFSV